MDATIKGWVWNIPFYPIYKELRLVKDIFYYDSSNDLEFVNFTEGYEILVPEELVIGSQEDKEWVRKNLALLNVRRQTVMQTDLQGNWTLVLNRK